VNVVDYLNSVRFTVLFSGGKDSLAALLWVLDNIDHGDWNILYIEVTGNTHPLCTEYVERICDVLGLSDKLVIAKRKDLDFFECIEKWGIPIIGKYRWCLWQFKVKVIEKHAYPIQVTGMSRRDSFRRKKIKLIDVFWRKFIVVNPLYNWSKEDILKIVKKHEMEINPCYRKYGHSGNCMFCPYHAKNQILLTLQDPYWRKKILSALSKVRAEKSPWVRKIKAEWMKASKQLTLVQHGWDSG